MDRSDAYRVCQEITRSRAGNFYYGIRLLPPQKRRGLSAVYAFARRVDDVGDGSLPAEQKLDRLERLRASVSDIGPTDRESLDPVLAALADAAGRFALPMSAFSELIDGVERDVRGAPYPTFSDLERYCRLVAGTIGRLSTAVFGVADRARVFPLADDLGVAMQLTNVLRDVREDRERGRTYLPTEDLERFECSPDPAGAPAANVGALFRFEAARARKWFAQGLPLVEMLDPRSASCVLAMTGIYRRLLDRLEHHPSEALSRRMSLPAWEKALVAGESLATAARTWARRPGDRHGVMVSAGGGGDR